MRSHSSSMMAAVLGLWVASIAPADAQAQDRNDFSQLQATLKQNDKLTVTTESGMKIKGKLIEVSPDQIVLNSNGAPQQIPASRILKVQRKHNGVLLGALIGAGVGILPAVAISSYTNNEGGSSAWAAMPIGVGAAMGVGIDALLSKNRTVYQRNASQRVTLTPVVDRNRRGVRLALQF